MEYEVGWSRKQILLSPKGFWVDSITYQPTSYPTELFNLAIYYLHLRLKKTNRQEPLTLPRFLVHNNPRDNCKT